MQLMESARLEMVEAGGRTAQSFGLNRLHGQIYMLLYLDENAQSLDEIADQLGVSKASVSIACRQMAAWGALNLCWKKGDRRDYYSATTDFRRVLKEGLIASLSKKLDSAKTQIERSMALLNGLSGNQTVFVKNRLQEAEKFRAKVGRLLNNPLLAKLL